MIAQTQTARLVGTVHDASGATIPRARVTATHEETKRTTEASTSTSGEYVLGFLGFEASPVPGIRDLPRVTA
jgi:hypothetical protein